MEKTRILIVDKNDSLAKNVQQNLSDGGFEIEIVDGTREIESLKSAKRPHLLIIGTQTPGLDSLKELQVPILVLPSSDTGSFEKRELLARVNSMLTRAWRFKGLVVHPDRRSVELDNQTIELTTAEFDLLRMLVSNAQKALSREELLEQLRGIEWEAIDRSIDILVSRLRDKLKDDPRRPRFIRTVRSVGYQFIGESEIA